MLFNDPPASRRIEMNNYEAAEVVMVGTAQETILGMKETLLMDNVVDVDMMHRAFEGALED